MIGQTLGHYEIAARLGQGGMGEVYRARDTRLERDVALKVLPPELAGNQEVLDRFRREARALAALDHPGIVAVYSVEEVGGVHFLTMQLVEGRTLDEIIPKGGLPPDQLASIAVALADALVAAHEKGIVHRDLKPANVMVGEDGRVKVLDFGLAKLTATEPEGAADATRTLEMQTRAGVVMGTMPYMSPEQAEGRPLDHRTDIFSLGVLLYEMTTGERPFRGASPAALVSSILRDEPQLPTRPDISPSISSVIADCLQKDPARRVQTARDFRTALNSAIGDSNPGLGIEPKVPERLANRPSGFSTRAKGHTVGRRAEIHALRDALAAATTGRSLLVGVAGEPGLGKTTLVEEFLAWAEREGSCTVARGRCSERLAGSEAYLPILDALDGLMQGGDGATATRTVKEVAPVWYSQAVPASGQSSESAQVLEEIQDANQERLKREFVALVQELSRPQPLVLFLDDIHWADVSTVDLLGYLAGKFDSARALVVLTYRPSDLQLVEHPFLQIRPDMEARGLFVEMPLAFLQESETAAYLDLEFPAHGFPRELSALIHRRTEGNPLFMSNLMRYLQDRGAIGKEEGRWILTVGLQEVEQQLPESVRAMIERKIGQLADGDRTLLTVASVQGHTFDSTIIAQALNRPADEVEDRLDVLERVHALVQLADEVELPDRSLNLRYNFVHALYQNTLHAALRPTRRARLSLQVGQLLEQVHGMQTRGIAHELAMLFEAGRDFEKAARHYLVAAQQANRVFADREAWTLADKGLGLAQKLENSVDRNRLELELLLALGLAVRSSGGFGHPEAQRAYVRARELCRALGETPHLFQVLFGLWEIQQNQADLGAAIEVGREMLALAQRTGDTGQLVAANAAMADNLLCLGDPVGARRHAADAISHYDPARHHELAHDFGYDPAVSAHSLGALALWLAGYPEQALQESRAAVRLAQRLLHPSTQAFAALFASWVACWHGDLVEARSQAERCIASSTKFGLPVYSDFVNICRGLMLIGEGDPGAGATLANERTASLDAIGFRWARTFMLAVVAEGHANAGDTAQALIVLDEAFAYAERSGERFYVPELLRLKGECLLRSATPKFRSGEQCLREAVDTAQRQQARSWALRATVSLARMWHEQGRSAEGLDRLAPLLSSFTEGLETADLRAARTLLQELDGRGTRDRIDQPPSEPKSIVIVPFANRSPDPDNEYFSDGLSEELIADLSRVSAFRVISHNSAMQLKGTDKDTPTIGRELNVRYVLTGGVRKAGYSIRVTASLADASEDRVIWTGKYGGVLDDIFEMQEQVSRAIVEALQVPLSPEEDHELATHNVADARAYDLYLRARQDIIQTSKERCERAIRLLQDGLTIEGESPLLLAMLGYARVVYLKMRWPKDEDRERREIARCLERLVARAPESPHTAFLQGMIAYESGDLRAAVPHLSASVERDSKNPEVLLWLLVCLLYVGRDSASVLPLFDHLLAIDPLTPMNIVMKGAFAAFDGHLTEAIPFVQEADSMDPTVPDTVWSHGYILALDGHLTKAAAVADRLAELAPDFVYTSQLAAFLAGCRGDAATARMHLSPNVLKAAEHDQHLSLHLAEVYALIDEPTKAIAHLQAAIEHGFVHYPFFTERNPFLARLKGNAKFTELMEHAKAEWQHFAALPLPTVR